MHFEDVTIQLTAGGAPVTLSVPSAAVTYSPAAPGATTVFNAATHEWETVVPSFGVARNTFRAGSVFDLNLAVAKIFLFSEGRALLVRTEVFNLTDRANFGVPVRFLEAVGFGRATSTLTPARRIQFYLRYSF